MDNLECLLNNHVSIDFAITYHVLYSGVNGKRRVTGYSSKHLGQG